MVSCRSLAGPILAAVVVVDSITAWGSTLQKNTTTMRKNGGDALSTLAVSDDHVDILARLCLPPKSPEGIQLGSPAFMKQSATVPTPINLSPGTSSVMQGPENQPAVYRSRFIARCFEHNDLCKDAAA